MVKTDSSNKVENLGKTKTIENNRTCDGNLDQQQPHKWVGDDHQQGAPIPMARDDKVNTY